jgi:hypothetical protein
VDFFEQIELPDREAGLRSGLLIGLRGILIIPISNAFAEVGFQRRTLEIRIWPDMNAFLREDPET